MNALSKYKFWIGGGLCLIVLAVIVGALWPKHVSGAPHLGTLDGFVNADVHAQVTGYLMRQAYQEGAYVKQGQLLFQIDPRPFRAALDQAKGQLAQAIATLANAEANQRRTQLDVDRYTPLAKEQAASQQDLDNAIQYNLAAQATVQTAKAQIETYQAAVETAKIN